MKTYLKQIVSLFMTVLMILSTMLCLSGVSLAADAVTETEPNDGSNTATAIPVDTVCSGWMGNEKDIDWYKFTTDKDYFTFSFEIDMSETNYDQIKHGWDVLIYTDNGVNVLKEYTYVTKTFTTAILPFSGTYYIKVLSCNYDNEFWAPINCKYNIKVDTVVDDSWEDELNDTSATAFNILSDKMYHGTFHNETDVDWYRFENKKDNFKLDFKINESVSYDNIKRGWIVEIYLPDGVTLIKKYENVTENFITPELPFKGEYLIKIYADYAADIWAPIDCYYDITVDTIENENWEKENNDSTATATEIVINNEYTGFLYNENDVDKYVFENQNGAFNIDFKIDKSVSAEAVRNGWKISLFKYGSSEPIVEYLNIITDMISFDLPYIGKYELVVSADYAADIWAPIDCYYNFKIVTHPTEELWEAEENDFMDKATSISDNNAYSGNVDNDKDIDYFMVKAPYDGVIKLNYSRAISDKVGDGWKVSILKATGKVVAEKVVKDDIKATVKADMTKDEALYIKVEAAREWDSPKYINYAVSVDFLPAPAKVEKLKASSVKTTSVKFSWKEVGGADEYEVAYSTNGKSWKKVTTTKTSITLKNLKSGTTYKVKVRAVDNSVKGKYSSVVTVATKVSKVTLSSVKSTKKAQANVVWKTVTGASGYVVEYSTSKKFTSKTTKKVALKKSAKKTTLKKLKSGKKYYVRVKAYKTVNGKKVYGAYSSVKSVKVK